MVTIHLQDAVDCTYFDVRKLIFAQVYRFVRTYGGDAEELIAEANLIFMDGYHKYDANRGASFLTWIGNYVWWSLSDKMRTRLQREYFCSREHINLEEYSKAERIRFSVGGFVAELSTDAAIVVMLVLESTSIPEKKKEKVQFRRRLRKTLRTWGWSLRTIRNTFTEIEEALR